MESVKAYAAYQVKEPLKPFEFKRRMPGPEDVVIHIDYCGVCHSDIHQARNEWGNSHFPMVPGHEIVGTVEKIGPHVKRFKPGDKVGVGCFVDSCRECDPCHRHLEQYCIKGCIQTYNAINPLDGVPTYGGYSTKIVVDENYVLRLPKELPLAESAPLLCAGITTYSPLKHWQVGKGDKVAVLGLGGLGHMGVKLANALGAEVTVFSTSEGKKKDALRLGATHFVNTKQDEHFTSFKNQFKVILNTISANIPLDRYLSLLKLDGTMVMVGVPEQPLAVHTFSLITNRISIAGSLIGGILETQEMLDFCGQHKLVADIEVIPIQKINEAYDRTVKGDVHYRFVIDNASLRT